MTKCNYPDCKQEASMLAILRAISEDYKPLKGKIVELPCCTYHFCVLQSEQFNYVTKTKEIYGPVQTVKLIEAVMAGKMLAETKRKNGRT